MFQLKATSVLTRSPGSREQKPRLEKSRHIRLMTTNTGEPLHRFIIHFPFIYKEIQTMQTSFTKHQVVLLHFHSPSVHVVIEKEGNIGLILHGQQTNPLLNTSGPIKNKKTLQTVPLKWLLTPFQHRESQEGSEIYRILLFLEKKQKRGEGAPYDTCKCEIVPFLKNILRLCISFVVSKVLETKV